MSDFTERYITVLCNPNSTVIEHLKSQDDEWKPQWLDKAWRIVTREDVDRREIADFLCRMNYKDFLKTPYWKIVAEKSRKLAGYRCKLCNRHARSIHVHHRTYKAHGFEHKNLEDLTPLCKGCHSYFHEVLEWKLLDELDPYSEEADRIKDLDRY